MKLLTMTIMFTLLCSVSFSIGMEYRDMYTCIISATGFVFGYFLTKLVGKALINDAESK